MTRIVTLALAGLLLALGLVLVSRQSSRDSLRPCDASGLIECGSIDVFEDRAVRAGRRIEIHYAVARAAAPGVREAVFVFAGGPGQGSTAMVAAADGWLQPLRSSLDLVFVDQRGTGRSHALMCPEVADPTAAFGHVYDPARVASCREALVRDADLTKYTTDPAVADVDDVRSALGYERVSLYGVSYGTRMAQAYMRRFPSRVRSAVLDGVVPFDVDIPLTYAASAQHALDRVWEACARRPGCGEAERRADFARLQQRLTQGPIAAGVTAGGSTIQVRMSRGDFAYAVRGLLYRPDAVTRLPGMVAQAAASGDLGEFAAAYWSRETALERTVALGMHLSVLCAEDVPFATDAEIGEATANTFLGRYLFDEYRAACRLWPRATIAADARTPVKVPVPTLLVSGGFDPVTPPAFAERVAASLPVSLTITSPAGAHGSAPSCPRQAALHVLGRGTLTGVPAVCQ